MSTLTKHYELTYNEVALIRDALIDLKHHLNPASVIGDASNSRVINYRRTVALVEQFQNDARLMPTS